MIENKAEEIKKYLKFKTLYLFKININNNNK